MATRDCWKNVNAYMRSIHDITYQNNDLRLNDLHDGIQCQNHEMPEKPLSDSEAMFGKNEPFLAQIVEDDAEQDVEVDRFEADVHAAKDAGSGNWKELGRGFGYEDPKPTAAPAVITPAA